MHKQLLQRRRPAAQGPHLGARASLNNPDNADSPVNSFSLSGPLTLTIIETADPAPTLTQSNANDAVPATTPASPTTTTSTITVPPSIPSTLPPPDAPPAPPPTSAPSSSIPTTSASSSSSTTQSFHLPGGTIAAVVVVSVVGLLGLLVLLVRKRYINNRRRKTFTWGAGIMNKPVSSADMAFNNTLPTTVTTEASPVSSFSSGEVSPAMRAARFRTQTQPAQSPITPPPMSYNNPVPPLISGIPSPGLGPATPNTITITPGREPPNSATVQCTFIPTLPDELSISTGEIVQVLGEFDDGWALCANSKGEQGMVPLECLDRGESGLRNSRRTSSLRH
jgi:hypothetical protein